MSYPLICWHVYLSYSLVTAIDQNFELDYVQRSGLNIMCIWQLTVWLKSRVCRTQDLKEDAGHEWRFMTGSRGQALVLLVSCLTFCSLRKEAQYMFFVIDFWAEHSTDSTTIKCFYGWDIQTFLASVCESCLNVNLWWVMSLPTLGDSLCSDNKWPGTRPRVMPGCLQWPAPAQAALATPLPGLCFLIRPCLVNRVHARNQSSRLMKTS